MKSSAGPNRRPPLWLLAVFLAAGLAAYQPAWHGTPVWDDDGHLTRAELEDGAGFVRIWTELGATQQYYPVTHSAFWVMNALWGHEPLGYHLVNVTLHALSAWLVVWLLMRIGAVGAVLAGALFLLHPVHVESVAWMSELKNVLSGALYFAAALAYLKYDESRHSGAYGGALALFVLAVLAKSVTASLPAALLVVFWWQRGRIARADVLPLLPFFVVAIAAAVVTPYVEAAFIGAQGRDFALTWAQRIVIAGRATWFYLATLVWPSNLSFVYQKWTIVPASFQALFPIGLAVAAGAAFLIRRRTRAPLAALLLFVGTLFPALGFVDVFPFRYSYVANHFVYLASVPMLALIAATLVFVASRLQMSRAVSAVLASVLAAPMAWATWRHSADFRDVETLYLATIDANPEAWLAYNNLAEIELRRPAPDLQRARALLETAIALEANNAEALNNLGVVYQQLGRLDLAYEVHLKAVALLPGFADAYNNLGVVALASGRTSEARIHLTRALALRPNYPEAHYNMGNVELAEKSFRAAATRFESAISLKSGYSAAHNNLGMAREGMGDWAGAVAAYRAALGYERTAVVLGNLGYALLRAGQPDAAEAPLREAVRLSAESWLARRHLGDALAELGRLDEAIASYREALALEPTPGTAETHNNLGVALAMKGHRTAAAQHFRTALRIRPGFEDAIRNLKRLNAGMSED